MNFTRKNGPLDYIGVLVENASCLRGTQWAISESLVHHEGQNREY